MSDAPPCTYVTAWVPCALDSPDSFLCVGRPAIRRRRCWLLDKCRRNHIMSIKQMKANKKVPSIIILAYPSVIIFSYSVFFEAFSFYSLDIFTYKNIFHEYFKCFKCSTEIMVLKKIPLRYREWWSNLNVIIYTMDTIFTDVPLVVYCWVIFLLLLNV